MKLSFFTHVLGQQNFNISYVSFCVNKLYFWNLKITCVVQRLTSLERNTGCNAIKD